MVGPKLYIKTKEVGVTLAPYKREYSELFADLESSLAVHEYTAGPYGRTKEDEDELFEQIRKAPKSVSWVIIPDGQKDPVGYTAIHNITNDGSCSTEIQIMDQKWWGKGIATQAHLIRTWYAVNSLSRNIMSSSLAENNIASRKALESVGYFVTGKKLRNYFAHGVYSDGLQMYWLNPKRINVLFPEGLPREYEQYVEKAKEVLTLAEKNIKIL